MCSKVLIWGTGLLYNKYKNVISFYEEKGEIDIIGVTSNDNFYTRIDGYTFIKKSEIVSTKFDYIIVTAVRHYSSILDEVKEMGIDSKKVLRVDIFDIPNFSFKKYITLLGQCPTIITNNCWGGVTYHSLKLPFYSPFVNMYIEDEDYIRMISSLREYMHEKLEFCTSEYNSVDRFEYPVFLLGDVKLHMNHYRDRDDAMRKWEERKARINWDNLFVMMYTESQKIAEEFSNMGYEKKVCFVPFESDKKSCMPVRPYIEQYSKTKEFWEIVLGMASGKYPYYDAIELLLTGNQKIRTFPQ